MGTLDAHLVAFDAKDGKVLWDKEVADPAFGYSITHAPLIIGDNVIVGVSGGEYGIRGHVTAYNAMTGDQVWRWYSIPAPKGDSTFDDKAPNGWFGTWAPKAEDADLHRDLTKEKGDSAKYADAWKTGGGGVWTTPSYDKESNTLFVTVGNPSPDLDGSIRPGDNLYTDCIVAIDASSGKTKWYYQTVPHDVWDLDATSPVGRRDAGRKKVVLHAGKTGWLYVVDAANRQARPQERRLRPAGEHVRPAERQGHADAAGRQRRLGMVADLGRSHPGLRLRRGAAPADELHRAHARRMRRAACGSAPPSWPSRARSSTASSPRSTSRPARSPGRTRCRSR